MDNKGFAITGILYGILILFLTLLALIIFNLQGKKVILDKQKKDVFEDINDKTIRTIWVFTYSGTAQEFVAPKDGNYKIELWGAEGGSGYGYVSGGAYTSGNISLSANTRLIVSVGMHGMASGQTTTYNYGYHNYTYEGGGSTDIRLVGGSWDNFDSLKSRIMVAAGGGTLGGLNSYDGGAPYGGAAGGLVGYQGGKCISNNTTPHAGAMGATQTSGHAFGKVLLLNTGGTTRYNGSGGNGYYSGNYYDWTGIGGHSAVSGAGGGSSYISGYSGCNSISASSTESNIVHTGSANHYSGKVFTSAVMIDGKGCDWSTGTATNCGTNQPQPDGTMTAGHSGNGYARITYLG